MLDLAERRRRLDRLQGDYRHARRAAAEERDALAGYVAAERRAAAAQQIIQAVAQGVQDAAHHQIARVVTRCLKAVFGAGAYEFRIDFSRKRGKTEAELLFVRGGAVVDPVAAAGGGVVDLASFALRLSCLLLAAPHRRRLLVLDEPMKHLSRDYAPRVRELLETLARELDLQIIMVTHSPDLAAGKVVEL